MTTNERNSPAFGPSDSSDAGADLAGSETSDGRQEELSADLAMANGNPGVDGATDRNGTGERMSAGAEEIVDAADIGFDRVVGAAEAGVGAGLDQAEEAQLGITDEELEKLTRNAPGGGKPKLEKQPIPWGPSGPVPGQGPEEKPAT
jgi:hypothetical protein